MTHSPFLTFKKPITPRINLTQLTGSELEQLQKKHLPIERLAYIRDLFLFQCNTGLSFSDIFNFSSENVVSKGEHLFLSGKRIKTDIDYYLPFTMEAQLIAKKYNYTFKNISNQKYNAYLKEIAILCEIPKNLTTHVGRKTFSQIMIDAGYSGESVAKMMGHASFTMTQKHYGRIGENRIETEFKRLKVAA